MRDYDCINFNINLCHISNVANRSKEMKNEIEKAKELLQANGYYVGGLWHINDVKDHWECTDCEAELILAKAIVSERTFDEIWFAINYTAEHLLKLKEKEDEN
jgi:hypothetical protein